MLFQKSLSNFHPSHAIAIGLILVGALFPIRLTRWIQNTTWWIGTTFNDILLLSISALVVFAIVIAVSRYGALRLGGENETPQFSLLSWFAMLFAAGMGGGLVFHGAAEPLIHVAHFSEPSGGMSVNTHAMAITYFHWGLHAWAIYALAALTIAYFSFRHQTALLPSAPFEDSRIFAGRRWVLELINTVAVFAILCGLIASLGVGSALVFEGIQKIYDTHLSAQGGQGWVIVILSVCFITSAMTGVGKGIKWLSNINMLLSIALLLFIAVAGSTLFQLDMLINSTVSYLTWLPELSYNTAAVSSDEEWIYAWPITYLLWWVSWAPFVGVFIARISRGRTIRQFILGVLAVPTLFSCIWFAVIGGEALRVNAEQNALLAQQAAENMQGAMFSLLDYLPASEYVSALVVLLAFIFLITSADSGAYVLSVFSSNGAAHPSRMQRLFWGIVIALVTFAAISSGKGLDFIRAIAVAGAVPYMVVLVFQLVLFCMRLRKDDGVVDSQNGLSLK